MRKVKLGRCEYDYVEVMACPSGGCTCALLGSGCSECRGRGVMHVEVMACSSGARADAWVLRADG